MSWKQGLDIKLYTTNWSVTHFVKVTETSRGSNQSQNKSTEIKQSSSIYVPFAQECKRKLREPFVLRTGFMLTYSNGTRYPECASSIHTTISTRPGECKSADLLFQHVLQSGRQCRRSSLALRRDRDIPRKTSRFKFMIATVWGGGYTAPHLLFHFSLCLP